MPLFILSQKLFIDLTIADYKTHEAQKRKMAETPIKFGILGCAKVARKVCRALTLAPNTTLYAIGSRAIEKASSFAAANSLPGWVKLYGSYEGVLDDPDVDAVYLPLPASLHLKWAVLAAEKKKHVLLEKPGASNVSELDQILQACEANGVQFMDATMWMHHPRTSKMKEFLNSQGFGQLKSIYSSFSYKASPDFLQDDIRMKPELTAQGAVGDLGWYPIGAILWANDYQLPKNVIASRNPNSNESGVILSCGSSLYWEDGRSATFYASYLTDITMDITALGSEGSLRVHDFVVPFQEDAAHFYEASNSRFVNLSTGCEPVPDKRIVATGLPQEALMVQEFASLVARMKVGGQGLKPEKKWGDMCRKTQVVVDAVFESIQRGFEPVDV